MITPAPSKLPRSADVVIIGAGNAAFCARARRRRAWGFGSGARTRAGGGIRRQQPIYGRRDALRLRRRRRPEDADARSHRRRRSPIPISAPTPQDKFFDDMGRVTRIPHRSRPVRGPGQAQPAKRCSGCARKACGSCRSTGGRPSRSTASSSSGAASPSKPWGGGPGLVEAHTTIAKKNGINIAYDARALVADRRRRRRARACASSTRAALSTSRRNAWCSLPAASRRTPKCARATSGRAGNWRRCAARASIPATASAWRSTSARMPTGNWSGCHAVGWDRNAPEFGDLAVGDNFQKHSYPLGHHDQCQRRALRRRGRGLPQLHLREIRPRRFSCSPASSPGRSSTRR